MKKSITSAALIASAASAFAIVAPPIPVQDNVQNPAFQLKSQEAKFYCLAVFEEQDGSKVLGSCDEAHRNYVFGAEVDDKGCTIHQAALRVTENIKIAACPAYVQL